MFGRRILILVAHPDDEVVACAASITRARAEGATISALYLTHGCLARDTLWPWQRKSYQQFVDRRRAEADAAATFLGIQPVGWSDRPARHLWQNLPDVYQEVEQAINQYRPDQLWVPAYEGGNPDHDALNAIGFSFKTRLSVLEFTEYNYYGGKPRSQTFISADETTRILTLNPEEQTQKKNALALYASERGNLSSIACQQESYRPISAYDYAQPPHQGTLWYNRFQWVPFRHPRIDRTPAQMVSQAMQDFLTPSGLARRGP